MFKNREYKVQKVKEVLVSCLCGGFTGLVLVFIFALLAYVN